MAHAQPLKRPASKAARSPGATLSPAVRAGVPGAIAVGEVPNRPLVQALAARLRASYDEPDAPLVVLNRIPQTSSVHLLVVWDKWRDLSIPARGRAIADAFAAAFPKDAAVVRLPLGLTPGEALAQGHLPYQISALVRASDNVADEDVRAALVSAGGVPVSVGSDHQLRFATREQAENAYRRLVQRINKPIWAISEDRGSADAGA